ncbi:MAG: energy transducer TonB [bacterium]
MSSRFRLRRARSGRRALDLAIAASIALHLVAFALFPPLPERPVPVESSGEIEFVDVVPFEAVPPPPPPPRSRPVSRSLAGDLDETPPRDIRPDLATPADADPPPLSAPVPIGPRGETFRVFEQAPKLRRAEDPEYPELARAAGLEGEVLLRISVDERGRVVDVVAVRSDGSAFADAALAAARRWTFDPARMSGRPVASTILVPVRFTLR